MNGNLLIKNGVLVGPNGSRAADILVKDGLIEEISADIQPENEVQVLDVKGKTVMPSFADMHVHLRDPGFTYKEDLESGIKAAVNGGFTHITAMGNTNPAPDNLEVLSDILSRAKALNLADVYQVATVTKGLNGKEAVDFAELRKLTQFFSDDGKNVDNEEIFSRAMRASGELDFKVLDHSEPETEMVIRNIKIAKQERGNLHFCHISRKESMLAIMQAKDEGINVTVEVTPHHLFGWDLDYRVAPPFAAKDDADFLLRAVGSGYVDCISTDHAPHTAEDKAKGMNGISGLDVAFSIINTVFAEAGYSLSLLSRLMSLNPMRFMRVNGGTIMTGKEANLVIVDPDATYTINPDKFVSKGKNTPFAGREVAGKVIHTIKKGVILK
jgi:dihydroorotase